MNNGSEITSGDGTSPTTAGTTSTRDNDSTAGTEPSIEPGTGPGTFTSYLCIGCPLGCRLEVEENADHEIVEVRGHSCRKGDVFARQEHVDPRRMLTTTVAVRDGRFARLPVRSVDTIPRDLVVPLCERLRTIEMTAPVSMGEVVLADALGSGVDVIASRGMPRDHPER